MHQKTRTRISRTACPCEAPLRSRTAARSPRPRAEPALQTRSSRGAREKLSRWSRSKILPQPPLLFALPATRRQTPLFVASRARRCRSSPSARACARSRRRLFLPAPLRRFAKPPPQQQRQPRTLAPVCLLREDPKPLNFLHFQLHLHGNHRLSSNPPHPP